MITQKPFKVPKDIFKKKLKILHLEDLKSDVVLIGKAIKKGEIDFELLVVETKEKFVEALTEYSPDIILADHSLPSFNSHEALTILHETGLIIPFILITATMSDEFAVDVIKRGADDYILKDRLSRLPTAIHNLLEKFRLERERQLFFDELIKRERRYHALVENGTDAIVILNVEGNPTYVSASIHRVLGYTESEAMQLGVYKLLHADDREGVALKMQECLLKPGIPIEGYTARIKHKDGSWRWMDATLTNMLHDAAINGIVDNFRDVTERKLAEERVAHLNRLYAFLSQINQTIVHSDNEETVFRKTCDIACNTGKFKAAWIGLIDPINHTVSLVTSCEIPDKDIPTFTNIPFKDDCVQAKAILTDTYYICNNIADEDKLKEGRPFAAERGYKSSIVLPLKKLGVLIGTFNLYASEIDFFTTEEIDLLLEASNDISFALNGFERQKLKSADDELIKHKKLLLKQAQEIAHLGSWEMDFSTGTGEWSEEACKIYGIGELETMQTYEGWLTFLHPEDKEYVLKATNDAIAARSRADFFHRIIKPDGSIRHIHTQSMIKFGDTGEPIGLTGVTHDVTDMKKAEQALRESESNLSAIFNSTSEGFILSDENGIVKSFNRKAGEFIYLNIEKTLAVGDSIYDFVHESRKGNYKGAISKILSGETLHYDYPFIRKDGETYWFNFTINPVYTGDKIDGISITSNDISERKRAEELLRRSQSNLNAIIENNEAFIYSLDTDLCYVTFNQKLFASLKDVYGFEIKEGYRITDHITKFSPGELDEWKDVYARALQGEIVAFEKEFKIDDHYSYTSFSIHPIWENESVIGLSCFVMDITQAKVAEEENRFKANLLSKIGQAAVAINMKSEIIYWNKAAEDIYGWKCEEVIGKNIMDITPSETSTEEAAHIMEELMQGRSWSGEFRAKRKNGTTFPALVNDTPIYDEHNNLTGIIGISSDITEKKNLENLLDKTNQLARIGSWEVDLQNNTLYWSAITKEIHEVSSDFLPELATGINFYKEGPSRDAIAYGIENAIQHATGFDLQLQLITARGTERWVRSIGTPEFINGTCVKLSGSFQDIDLSKRSELEVLQVYEEKNSILESIGDAFFAVNNEWVVTYWNTHAEKILYGPKENILGKDLWTVFSDSIGSISYTKYHEAIETNQVVHFEDYYEPREQWYMVSAYPSMQGLSVYFRDITNEIKSKKALRQSEFRYRQIVETAQEGIWVIDENNMTTFVNRKMCEILGYPQEEMIGKTNFFFKDEEGLKTAIANLERRKQGISESHTSSFITKDGRLIWTQVSTNPIFENGEYKGALSMINDITQQKISENEREVITADLIQRNKDLEQFSYIVSHNLRAPVANIIGLSDELGYESHSDEIKAMFKKELALNVKRLDDVIIDLNDILQIKREISEKKETVVFSELVDNIKLSIHNLIEKEHIHIKTDFTEADEFSSIKSYLHSIFYNLISNAIKYRQPNLELLIQIKTQKKNDRLLIIFKDNGRGIDLVKKGDQVFGLYKRFHSNVEGKGMGLFMVKTQVEALDGKITISSEVNKGTEFTIELQYKEVKA